MTAADTPSFETMRAAMVASQLRTSGVTDKGVLAAMGTVPREDFVPADMRNVCYIDRAIPLGNGAALNPPLVTALLLNAAAIRDGDRVLIIGTATGYAAAIVRTLTSNVAVVESDLATGAPDGAPYDVIIVDGAIEYVPEALISQLVDGGRLAAAINDAGVSRLRIGRRIGTGFGMTSIGDFDAVRLPGFENPKEFAF